MHSSWLRAFIPFALVISGCLEVDVHTTVSADGSSERVISIKNSTRSVPVGAFPAPTDSSWSTGWKPTNDKEMKYEFSARKRFATPEALHAEYSARPDTGVVGLRVSLTKKFAWFYTYFEYDESYTLKNTFSTVPVSQYLSPDEVERYMHGDHTDSLRPKVSRWDLRNVFEELYHPLLRDAEILHDSHLRSLLAEKKEEMFSRLREADSVSNKSEKRADSLGVESSDDVVRVFTEALPPEAMVQLRPSVERSWASVMDALKHERKHPDGWIYTVQMPGLVTESNSNYVEGNLLTWKFSADQVHLGSYQMHATSRVTNVWACTATGLVAVALALITLRPASRRRRMPA